MKYEKSEAIRYYENGKLIKRKVIPGNGRSYFKGIGYVSEAQLVALSERMSDRVKQGEAFTLREWLTMASKIITESPGHREPIKCNVEGILAILRAAPYGLTRAEVIETVCMKTGATEREAAGMLRTARGCMVMNRIKGKYYACFYDPDTGRLIDETWKALL